jgi:hypothetical protein
MTLLRSVVLSVAGVAISLFVLGWIQNLFQIPLTSETESKFFRSYDSVGRGEFAETGMLSGWKADRATDLGRNGRIAQRREFVLVGTKRCGTSPVGRAFLLCERCSERGSLPCAARERARGATQFNVYRIGRSDVRSERTAHHVSLRGALVRRSDDRAAEARLVGRC